jgi:hypothetical protein
MNGIQSQDAVRAAQEATNAAARATQEAARTAARDAQRAAQDAARATQDAALAGDAVQPPEPPEPPFAPSAPGTIVIPGDGTRSDISINVDGAGIHLRQRGNETTIPIRNIVPRGAVQIAWAIPATLSILLIWWPLSRAVIGWLRRKTAVAQDSAALEARLSSRFEQMERNIDTVAVEMERLAEGQRFTNRLIAERQSEAVPVGGPAGRGQS